MYPDPTAAWAGLAREMRRRCDLFDSGKWPGTQLVTNWYPVPVTYLPDGAVRDETGAKFGPGQPWQVSENAVASGGGIGQAGLPPWHVIRNPPRIRGVPFALRAAGGQWDARDFLRQNACQNAWRDIRQNAWRIILAHYPVENRESSTWRAYLRPPN